MIERDLVPVEVRLPELAPSMTVARIIAWLKSEGEAVVAGEALAEMETDKVNVELEAPVSGVLTKICVSAGTDAVAVGSVLAVIDPRALDRAIDLPTPDDDGAGTRTDTTSGEMSTETESALPNHNAAESLTTPENPGGHVEGSEPLLRPVIASTPLAARMAALVGLDLSAIRPADGERITKADVERILNQRERDSGDRRRDKMDTSIAVATLDPGRTSPSSPFQDQPLSAMRRVTAGRLQQAKQTIPHFYLQADCVVDELMDLRATLNARQTEVHVTVTDFLVLAAALALRKVPAANSSWIDNAVRVFDSVDIAVAVNTANGLIAPVILGAHLKTLIVISRELKSLSERARRGQLKPDEYAGGTFTISNLGMFGVTAITPIINPPHSAILGVGAIEQRPIVSDGRLAIGRVVTCTLAADHRVIDGATAATLLAEVRRLIEEPMGMLFQA